MTLRMLKPSLRLLLHRVPSLTVQNLNPRPAGERWQQTRARIQQRDGSRCRKCGLIWLPERDVVDHRIPRWAGGKDDDSNLWLLHAEPCHAEKTEEEAAMQARGAYVMPQWVAATPVEIVRHGPA
jgi:5-methylcytosine-specific restriction endonuclease McrA